MLFVIIEHFRDGDAMPVYRRFRDRGRLASGEFRYVASWATADLSRCYQVMECGDRALLEVWMAQLKRSRRIRSGERDDVTGIDSGDHAVAVTCAQAPLLSPSLADGRIRS